MESLFHILDSLTLRLTNIRYMNDNKEISWLFELVKQAISNVRHSQQSKEELSLCKMLSDHCDNLYLDETFFPHIFCACFSKDGDSLGQWRAYADDGRGVAIGFSRAYLMSLVTKYRTRLEDVDYLAETDLSKLEAEARDSLERMKKSTQYLSDDEISSIARKTQDPWDNRAPFCKNFAFREEAEVRLVHIGSLDESRHPSKVSATGFGCRHHMIVPYKSIPLEPTEKPILEIVLGPRNRIEHNRRGVYNFAESKGIRLAINQITESAASYGELRRTSHNIRHVHPVRGY